VSGTAEQWLPTFCTTLFTSLLMQHMSWEGSCSKTKGSCMHLKSWNPKSPSCLN
jgi:hypothetical protein